jgi:hypothetical protein
MSENRRLEASVAADDRGPVPAKWGGDNAENHQVFFLYSRVETFLWWCRGWRRPESGDRMRERERRRREKRDAPGYATVRTQERYTGAAEACDPLDL